MVAYPCLSISLENYKTFIGKRKNPGTYDSALGYHAPGVHLGHENGQHGVGPATVQVAVSMSIYARSRIPVGRRIHNAIALAFSDDFGSPVRREDNEFLFKLFQGNGNASTTR